MVNVWCRRVDGPNFRDRCVASQGVVIELAVLSCSRMAIEGFALHGISTDWVFDRS
jgi:hypothetical protein